MTERSRSDAKGALPAERLAHLWWALGQALKRQLTPMLTREHGLEFKDFILLDNIDRGARHPGELAERMVVGASNMSRLLDEASKDGLVTRTLDPEDLRKMRLSITPRGEAVLKAVRATMVGLMAGGLEGFTASDVKRLVDGLGKLTEQLGAKAVATKKPARRRTGAKS